MPKMRGFQLARELEFDNKEFLEIMSAIGMPLKSHMSTIPEDKIDLVKEKIEEYKRGRRVETRVRKTVIRRRALKQEPAPPPPEPPIAPSPSPESGPQTEPVEPLPPQPPEVETDIVSLPTETPVGAEPPATVASVPAAGPAGPGGLSQEAEINKKELEREEAKPKKRGLKPAARKAREVIEVLPEEIPTLGRRGPNWRGGISVRPGGARSYMGPRGAYRKRTIVKKDGRKTLITKPKASKRIVKVDGEISVQELARCMGVKAGEILKKLIGMGVMVTINSTVDMDAATLVAHEFEYEVENVAVQEKNLLAQAEEDKPEDLVGRPPVVTVMGHVDHGKTSLLDVIRKTDVTSGEAGGITQHIGAYHVSTPRGSIVFLDTPGHEAFTAMRSRGAQVTDIVVLVVAADDGVMPQTVEAIDHAKAAEVPIIVAINKMDKPGADADRVKNRLMEYGLVPESFGGETIFVPVSAKEKTGIEDLLENILLQSEIMELKANPDKRAVGVVIEARVEKGRGPIATVLVREGTLKQGDAIVAGAFHGRVRMIRDDQGNKLKDVSPGLPAEVQGLSGVPMAGESFNTAKDEQVAKQVAEGRAQKQREGQMVAPEKVSLENLFEKMEEGETKELRIVVKADSQGSVEVVRDVLGKLSGSDVQVRTIHGAVGGVNESDVMLASASNAIVVGFHVRPDPKAQATARQEKVDIKLYTVIYEAVKEIREAMEGLLGPTFKETTEARAEIRTVFNIQKLGTIAGCMVLDGTVTRGSRVRVIRDSVVVYDGKISSLRRFKDDVKEVLSGLECGIMVENFNDVKVGDVLETYSLQELAPQLESSAASQ